jgi:hypothetical protein
VFLDIFGQNSVSQMSATKLYDPKKQKQYNFKTIPVKRKSYSELSIFLLPLAVGRILG